MATKNKPRSAQTGELELPQGSLWVQRGGANQELLYLTCHGVDGVNDDNSTPEYGYCIVDGRYVIRSRTQPAPAGASFDVMTGQDKVKSVMDTLLQENCPATFGMKLSSCGKPDSISTWDVWYIYPFATVNSRDAGALVAWSEQARIERTFSVTSPQVGYTVYRPVPKSTPVDPDETTFGTGAVPTNIHVPVNRGECGGACGAYETSCDFAIAGTNSGVGTPGATNESGVLITRDGGSTWTFLASGQDDVEYTHAVLLDDGTIVAVGNLDDDTAVWVALGSVTATTATLDSGSAIATGLTGATILSIYTDGQEVWFTTLNRIYRSTDSGVTWTLVHTGAAGDVIRSIHFSGEYGYAVGEDTGGATLVLFSANAGDSWSDISSQDIGDGLSVYAHQNIVWLGTEDGLYYSTTRGLTWSERVIPGGAGVTDVEFYDENIAIAVSGTRVYMSLFGGAANSWSVLDASGLSGGQLEFCAPDTFWQLESDGSLVKYEPKLS